MSTTPDYLTEAGVILLTAAQANRKRDETLRLLPPDHPLRQELRAEALQIADGLTRLAAISRGLPPCICHPDPEESHP